MVGRHVGDAVEDVRRGRRAARGDERRDRVRAVAGDLGERCEGAADVGASAWETTGANVDAQAWRRCTSRGLAKGYGADEVFRDVSFRVAPGERLALVGRNGSGKTTLLRILAGEIGADAGEVGFPRAARIALHDQRPPRASQQVARGSTSARASPTCTAPRRGSPSSSSGWRRATHEPTRRCAAYAAAQAELEAAGGYAWRSRLEAILRGLGFADVDGDRPLRTFSGGELTRASLARALAAATRPAAARRAHEPPRPDARSSGSSASSPRSTPPCCSSRTTAGSSSPSRPACWSSSAAARGSSRCATRRTAARRRSRRAAGRGVRAPAGRARAARAVRRTSGAPAPLAPGRSRAEARSTASSASSGRARSARWRSASRRRCSPGGSCSRRRACASRRARSCSCDGAAFAVERGQRVALIGPNGAGKTTLVETLLGRRRAGRAGQARPQRRRRPTSPSTPRSCPTTATCSRR